MTSNNSKNMKNNPSIRELVESATSWQSLERSILEENVLELTEDQIRILHNPINFYFTVADNHSNKSQRGIGEPASGLPGTVVQKDGITYILNGIAHDVTHLKALKQSLAHAELVIGEPGLGTLYRGRNYAEQPRNDEIKYLPSMFDFIRYILAGTEPSAPIYKQLKQVLTGAFGTRVGSLDARFVKQKEIKDIETYRMKEGNPSNFSLPPSLEGDYYYEQLLSGNFNALTILRSLSEAEFIEKKAKEEQAKEVHWIGGLVHEPQIAYFLRHPEFADGLRGIYSNQQDRHFVSPENLSALAFSVFLFAAVTATELVSTNLLGRNLSFSALALSYVTPTSFLALAAGFCIKNLQTVSTKQEYAHLKYDETPK